ncbi:MAG TPA: transcriptional repressor [Gammaproteobacteria bacterium]|nr:transcriptional repressor [Gammaproteobacteria bacterium]
MEGIDDFPADKAGLVRLMRERGITPTHQRVEIALILFARPQHLSAEQILARVNEDGTLVSKATVYNTLGLFARKGLIREVIVDPTKVFYDPTTSPHHHFYNVDDGSLTDIDADAIGLGALPALPPGTTAEGIEVVIRVRNVRPLP